MLRPLRDRDFRLLWAGMTVSLLGDGVYLVAVAWQAYDVSNSPAALAVTGVAWTLPTVLLLPFGGTLSDRIGRRPLMITADLLRAAAVGGDLGAQPERPPGDLAPGRAVGAVRRGRGAVRPVVHGDRP